MKKALIIGSSGTLLNMELNKISKIEDQFDEVVRINNFETFGYEQFVGKRTTTWFTDIKPIIYFSILNKVISTKESDKPIREYYIDICKNIKKIVILDRKCTLRLEQDFFVINTLLNNYFPNAVVDVVSENECLYNNYKIDWFLNYGHFIIDLYLSNGFDVSVSGFSNMDVEPSKYYFSRYFPAITHSDDVINQFNFIHNSIGKFKELPIEKRKTVRYGNSQMEFELKQFELEKVFFEKNKNVLHYI